MPNAQSNSDIAQVLDRIAELLEYENANPFRIRAYREGAQSIRSAEHPVADFIRNGQIDKLDALPNVGSGITAVVSEYVTSGQSGLLEELESKASPEAVMAKVPGIGKELAGRIVDQLHIKTLPELEQAAHNGELASVEGFGAKRIAGIRSSLAGILSQTLRNNQHERTADTTKQSSQSDDRPSVSLLLDIDADYRKGAEQDKLQKIAPKRFNPDNEAWLPVLHAKRDGWEFTALFSNTAQAHKLEKTDDWVVIYYKRGDTERQHTVVTETKGPLKGKRVVRGRDADNRSFYKAAKT
jgi:DNA polymerase (family 10)